MYPQENEKKVKLYTGSYNAPVVTGDGSVYLGNGQGICLWEFDESTGEVRLEESWPEASKCFLAYHIAGWENALCGK